MSSESGFSETSTIEETHALNARTMEIPAEALKEQLNQGYLLGRGPSVAEIGRFAAFLATDTGSLLNSHVIDADMGSMGVI